MFTSEDINHLFNESIPVPQNISLIFENERRDKCGRPRDLSFTSSYKDWIWITRISFPVFLVIGTLGNVLGIVTLYGDPKGPKRTFLLGLFVADLWFLWNRLAVYLGSRVWGTNENGTTDLYGGFYQATAGIWLYLESVLFFSSQWILLAFSIDRFLAIQLPVQHYTRKRRHSFRLLGFIFLGSSVNALYIPVVYYWIWSNSNLQAGQLVPEFPTAFRQWRQVEMWWEVMDRLFAYCSIAVFNYMIIVRIKNAAIPAGTSAPNGKHEHCLRKHSNPTTHTGHRTLFRTPSKSGATKILVTSSFFFLATQSLDFVMALLVAFSQAPICLFHITNAFLNVYDPFRNLLVNVNFSLGFVFYLCFGTNFRRFRNSLCIPQRSPFTSSLSRS